MHLLATQSATLDEIDTAVDLGQSPADVVVLSFSDSDLSALAAAWRADRDALPSLRLASLKRLRHPMSVDLYVDSVIAKSRARHRAQSRRARLLALRIRARGRRRAGGAACCSSRCRATIAPDARLAALSTVSPRASRAVRRAISAKAAPDNVANALQLAGSAVGRQIERRDGARAAGPRRGMPADGHVGRCRGIGAATAIVAGGAGRLLSLQPAGRPTPRPSRRSCSSSRREGLDAVARRGDQPQGSRCAAARSTR